jgi:hypothetical protein
MAQIGELFKTLGKDETFIKYVNEIENNKTNSEIIDLAFEDNDFITRIKSIIDDESIIRNKMDIIIGQKRKNLESKKEKDKKAIIPLPSTKDDDKVIVEESPDNIQDDDNDNEYHLKFQPYNNDKTTWLNKYCFVERFDHRMRLVNHDIEMYY